MAARDSKTSLYEAVIDITTDYLGPTARRFIDRQIEGHANKKPQDLNARDLQQLIDWIQVAVSLLTEDAVVVKEFTSRLQDLSVAKKT